MVRSNLRYLTMALVLGFLIVATPGAAAVTSKKSWTAVASRGFTPNKPCTKLNAHAPRSTYDCVRVGNGLLWQSRGTIHNPFAVGEPGSTGQPNPPRVLDRSYRTNRRG